jgi:hypothetical protein
MLLPGASVDQEISALLLVSDFTPGPFVMRSAFGLACAQEVADNRSNDKRSLAKATVFI